jgi:Mlc titration factor MtfA (ptsG expression regulator)
VRPQAAGYLTCEGSSAQTARARSRLDQEGPANGAPWLPRKAQRVRWSQVMASEFAQLQARAERGEPGLLSDYGATNPAEFFAVASEVFFEEPGELARLHPALYRELSGLYRVNPLSWS